MKYKYLLKQKKTIFTAFSSYSKGTNHNLFIPSTDVQSNGDYPIYYVQSER